MCNTHRPKKSMPYIATWFNCGCQFSSFGSGNKSENSASSLHIRLLSHLLTYYSLYFTILYLLFSYYLGLIFTFLLSNLLLLLDILLYYLFLSLFHILYFEVLFFLLLDINICLLSPKGLLYSFLHVLLASPTPEPRTFQCRLWTYYYP